MATLKKRILFSDMDGTLISTGKTVSPRNVEAIQRFVELGGQFAVASGRSEQIAAPFLAGIPITLPAIVYNGAAVYDFASGRFLHKLTLPDELTARFLRIALECYPEVCAETYNEDCQHLYNPGGLMDHYITEENQPFRYAGLSECGDSFKLLFYGEYERLLQVEKRLRQLPEMNGLYMTFSSPFYLELLPGRATKGDALEWLIESQGLPREEIAAIGDFYNDITMLQTASLGAATGNAPGEVKAHANLTVADNDHAAVADLIEHYLIAE